MNATATIARKLDTFTIGGCTLAITARHQYVIVGENGGYTLDIHERMEDGEFAKEPQERLRYKTKRAALAEATAHFNA